MTNRLITMIAATALFAPLLALAATTAEFSPASTSVEAGQKFNVAISINPQGTANYAEKLEVNYPADILEVASFTLGEKWMAMTAAGYDSVDNTKGVLIKTAGYPSGFSSVAAFGTISFVAKKAGSGMIKIGSSSLAFQASSQSAITGNGTSFAVAALAPAPAPKTEVQTPAPAPVLKPAPKPTPSVTKPAAITTEAATTEPKTQVSPELQTAAASEAALATNGNVWLWVLIVILFIAVIVLGVMAFSKRKNN